MVYDTIHGVHGPYTKAVIVDEIEQSESVCMNSIPKDDVNGGHADPNLTYAKELVALTGLNKEGSKIEAEMPIPYFGAAAEGDGDRQGGLKGVARSMPTGGAVNLVAKDLNFDLFETPLAGSTSDIRWIPRPSTEELTLLLPSAARNLSELVLTTSVKRMVSGLGSPSLPLSTLMLLSHWSLSKKLSPNTGLSAGVTTTEDGSSRVWCRLLLTP